MKRRLEDADDGFIQNPTKMLSTDSGAYSCNVIYPTVGISSEQIERPVLASTPQTFSDRCRMTSASHRVPSISFQPNQAAESELRHVIDNFVSIYEQLDKNDNPDVKPNYSYSELAYLAMLRSPNFCLPIGQIYSYIQSRFKFFRNSTRKHWKNAVRHSLAKTMCFNKIPVGRGTSNNENLARSTYLWCILPNSIACFARGDYRATIDKETGTNTLRSAYFRMNSEPFWNAVGDYISSRMALFRKTLEASLSPGRIFESQTCVFPWKQENTETAAKPFGRREVFQNVQNTRHTELSKRQGNYGFITGPEHPQLSYPASSPEFECQSAHAQTSSSLHMYHTQTRSSSPVLRMPDAQCQNQLSFVERATPSHITDPWLPGFSISTPETSFCSSELERETSPCTPLDCTDSGYVETSTNDNSCKFLNSCKKQNSERVITSPINEHFSGHQLTSEQYDFNQFDLSPFSLSDFSDLNQSIDQPRITPEKRSLSPTLPQMTPCVGQPMYISTPVASQAPSAQQCRFMYQPVTPIQSYGPTLHTTAPMFFVNPDGMFSTAMLPNWVSYS